MSGVHLHLMLNHLPVVGTGMALLLLAYAAARRDDALARVCLAMFVALALAGVAAFLTGEPAEEAVEGMAGVSGALVEAHEDAARVATAALAALGAAALVVLVRFRGRPLPRPLPAAFLLAALLPAAAMAYAATLGGRIRHPEIRDGARDARAEAPAPGPTFPPPHR